MLPSARMVTILGTLGSKRFWLLELRLPVPNFLEVRVFACEVVMFVVELAFDPLALLIVMEGDRLRLIMPGVDCLDEADSEDLRSRPCWPLIGPVTFASL